MNIDFFLEQHPDASLREYVELCKAEEAKAREQMLSVDKAYRDWRNNYLPGKYFKIVFHANSIAYVKMDRPDSRVSDQMLPAKWYEIHNESKAWDIKYEADRTVNLLWLPNNPRPNTYNYSPIAHEITEEEYNEVARVYAEVKSKISKFI